MKIFVRACLLALPLLAASAASPAHAWGPLVIDAGINAHCNSTWGGGNAFPKAMPWYSYFPYQAYFQTPAPMGGWPYWPAAAAPPAVRSPTPATSLYYSPRSVQPAAYTGQAPSYWYGR